MDWGGVVMFEPTVEDIETDVNTIEHHNCDNFFRDNYRSVIIYKRDKKYPMFAGRRIRFNQLRRASKICYHRRSHTDWEA